MAVAHVACHVGTRRVLDGYSTDGVLAGKEYKDESDKNDVTKLSHAALPGSLFLNQVPLGMDASHVMALVRCCRGNDAVGYNAQIRSAKCPSTLPTRSVVVDAPNGV